MIFLRHKREFFSPVQGIIREPPDGRSGTLQESLVLIDVTRRFAQLGNYPPLFFTAKPPRVGWLVSLRRATLLKIN